MKTHRKGGGGGGDTSSKVPDLNGLILSVRCLSITHIHRARVFGWTKKKDGHINSECC